MEFSNRLYELRKQKGFSQEELANRLNVTRQTVSKWEVGDSTPDMEKLMALSDLFQISLDELVMGKEKEKGNIGELSDKSQAKIRTSENKKVAEKGIKMIGIFAAIILGIDVISMIIYFAVYGIPK